MYREHVLAFIDILFPKTCHICEKDIKNKKIAFDDYICASCASDMRPTPAISCLSCAGKLSEEAELKNLLCHKCVKDRPSYDMLTACYAYDGITKKLIHMFKYCNRPYLAKTISKLMQNALTTSAKKTALETDVVVPIPLHSARQREREFNQSELLAKEISASLNKPFVPALKRTRDTRPQVSLKKNYRLKNLQKAFNTCKPSLVKGKHILLIDDVVTTASTVSEASNSLRSAGALNISVLAFAKG